MSNYNDSQYMQLCLDLAAEATGRTAPNPLVGALVVAGNGKVVGQGFHLKAGEAHAEVIALKEAGDAARGGTLYLNLEPCCHHGRTPPCTDTVIASGVKKVVIAMQDPNPKVAGGGIAALNKAGIATEVGLLENEAKWLNRAFIKYITKSLPWVCLKLASTLDGKIADRFGSSRWITGEESRKYVHQLRNSYDAILIGSHTAVHDDPQLNVREIENSRDPVRVLIDTRLKLDPKAKLCQKASGGETIIFCSQEAFQKKGEQYPRHVKIVPIETADGKMNLQVILSKLAEHEILSVLCEGGSRLAGNLLSNGLIDEIQWLIAPTIVADTQAVPAITKLTEVTLKEALHLKNVKVRQLGTDILVQGLTNEFPPVN